MKKIVLGSLILLVTLGVKVTFAQNEDIHISRKQERAERKQAKAEAFEAEKERVHQMAMDRDMVLEAITISGKFGNNLTSVGPNNFVMIDSNQFVIQTSSPAFVGQNGVGGLTVRGTVASYTVNQDKNSTTVIAQLNTFGFGAATLTYTLIDEQNCRVTFSSATGTYINMAGPISRKADSKLFQGVNLY